MPDDAVNKLTQQLTGKFVGDSTVCQSLMANLIRSSRKSLSGTP